MNQSKLKKISSLKLPKYRMEDGLTTVEGTKLIREMLLTGYKYTDVVCTGKWIQENREIAEEIGENLAVCSPKEMERISTMKTPQGVLAVIPFVNKKLQAGANKSILCDGVSDPGNLGTILRIADWFGVEQVLTINNSARFDNPKVIRSSMGSWFRVGRAEVAQSDLALLKQSHTFYGAVMSGTNLKHVEVVCPAVIVIGSEAMGISESILKICDYKITIPHGVSAKQGKPVAESLNAALASAIICYHFSGIGG